MYDLIILGAGPAGLSASIYASCFKLNYLTLGLVPGGQMTLAPDILNYPGFDEITGQLLAQRMIDQLQKRGGSVLSESVEKIEKKENGFAITTSSGKTYETHTIILATGVERRKLQVPGEAEYIGKGVQYCATCERFDYQDKICAVVGGANAAAQTAMQLSHAAKKVYLIYRSTELRCDPIWLSQIHGTPTIEIILNTHVTEIKGDGNKMTQVRLETTRDQEKDLALDKLFVEIGGVPGTALFIPLGMKLDEKGFIDVDDTLATSLSGVYAAGDVIGHKHSIEQISSAVGTGATAAVSVFSFLKKEKAPSLWGSSRIKHKS